MVATDMIKQAEKSDSVVLATLASQLWKGHSRFELESELEQLTENPDAVCFIIYADNRPAGFAQCQLRRDYVEGTNSSPVGYLEGIFIAEEYRHKGYAAELLACCEKWALSKNCAEFASDCEWENESSLLFHLSVGFEVANRIICYRKQLNSDES